MTAVNDVVSGVVATVPADLEEQVGALTRMVEARDGELARLRERLSERDRTLDMERGAARQRIEELNDAAIEWAESNDLCSQFERFCDEHGLRGRTTEVDVVIRATVVVTISGVEVRRDPDSSDICDVISSSDVERALRGSGTAELKEWEIDDWD